MSICAFTVTWGKELAIHSSILTRRILPGESHGQRSLAEGPWGHKEWDTTDRLTRIVFIISVSF